MRRFAHIHSKDINKEQILEVNVTVSQWAKSPKEQYVGVYF